MWWIWCCSVNIGWICIEDFCHEVEKVKRRLEEYILSRTRIRREFYLLFKKSKRMKARGFLHDGMTRETICLDSQNLQAKDSKP